MSKQKNAIINVFNKENLDILIPYLEKEKYNIYCTNDNINIVLKLVSNKDIVFSISNYIQSPEIYDGSIKTLHPRIYGGILGLNDNPLHIDDLDYIQGVFFNLIVVNFTPIEKIYKNDKINYNNDNNLNELGGFFNTNNLDNLEDFGEFKDYKNCDNFDNFEEIQNTNNSQDFLLENIDIDRYTLLYAATKNYKNIDILCNPNQYIDFIERNLNRLTLVKDAFKLIMKNNIYINNLLNDDNKTIGIIFEKELSLKHGLNNYMKPSYVYTKNNESLPFEILNGKPDYLNLLDINLAIHLVLEVKNQLNIDCCTSYKHNSPAGVSTISKLSMSEYNFYNSNKLDLSKAASNFLSTRNIDPISSFGDIIGYSGIVDKEMANLIKNFSSDGIISYDYTKEAINILKTKKNGEYLILKQQKLYSGIEFRDVNGITLTQPTNDSILNKDLLKDLPVNIQNDMILGYITLKYTQSNSVCFVYNNKVIGIGAGQQNLIDCIKIAGDKSQIWMMKHNLHMNREKNIILVSDTFLSSIDNIDIAAEYNVNYILQPGGSIKDCEICGECIKQNIDMVLTNKRNYTH